MTVWPGLEIRWPFIFHGRTCGTEDNVSKEEKTNWTRATSHIKQDYFSIAFSFLGQDVVLSCHSFYYYRLSYKYCTAFFYYALFIVLPALSIFLTKIIPCTQWYRDTIQSIYSHNYHSIASCLGLMILEQRRTVTDISLSTPARLLSRHSLRT